MRSKQKDVREGGIWKDLLDELDEAGYDDEASENSAFLQTWSQALVKYGGDCSLLLSRNRERFFLRPFKIASLLVYGSFPWASYRSITAGRAARANSTPYTYDSEILTELV